MSMKEAFQDYWRARKAAYMARKLGLDIVEKDWLDYADGILQGIQRVAEESPGTVKIVMQGPLSFENMIIH